MARNLDRAGEPESRFSFWSRLKHWGAGLGLNEAVNYMSAGQIMLGQDDGGEPHYPIWMVFDQRHRNRYLLATAVFPRQALPQSWYDAGIAKKGSTIDLIAYSFCRQVCSRSLGRRSAS